MSQMDVGYFLKIITLIKNAFHSYVFSGLSGQDYSEQSRKVLLINLFCLVGILVTFPLGILALFNQQPFVALGTLGISLIYTLNHLYLRQTLNYHFSSNIILFPLFALMYYLIYSGGVAQTGFVWIFCIPSVALFLHGLRRGMIEIISFTLALWITFKWGSLLGASNEWSMELKHRILYSFAVVTFLSAFYEYSRMKSLLLLESLRDEMEYASLTDHLTNLLNRRGMLQKLTGLHKKVDSVRFLALCDLDYFKEINDKYGHNMGDSVLLEIANIFRSKENSNTHFARWGGEEFLMLFENQSKDEVLRIIENIRKEIETLPCSFKNNITSCTSIKITASFGVTLFESTKEIDHSISQVDKKLYQAKHLGRNRIVS